MTEETHGSATVRGCKARVRQAMLGAHAKATGTWTLVMKVVVK
jgi:hypothetical protein